MAAEQAPRIIPVFPLTGSFLLPGARLPLHIFEPRYRHMMEDALGGEPFIGMIQPLLADPEEGLGPTRAAEGHPDLYEVGCAGRIDRWRRLSDGRYLIILRGERRFRTVRELPLRRGYRRVEVDYDAFGNDVDPGGEVAPETLLDRLRSHDLGRRLGIDVQKLERLGGVDLINTLSIALPFSSAEKQALLEAPTSSDRQQTLLTLLEMGLPDRAVGVSELAH